MAIKISGTTVIDDNRRLTNIESVTTTGNSHVKLPVGTTADRPSPVANGALRYNNELVTFEGYAAGAWGAIGASGPSIWQSAPVNTSPANGAAVSTLPTLAATNVEHIYDDAKVSGTWQVSVTPTFSNTDLNITVSGSANSYTLTSALSESTTYYWRVKYADANGNETDFSTSTQFTTATAPPTVIGQSFEGGYYMGIVCNVDCSVCYYLIVSPLATGQTACQWQTSQEFYDDCYTIDGYINTYCCKACSRYPAANWTATRTINGYSDWYLPATTEQFNYIIGGDPCLPVGDRFTPPVACWWSSNQSRDPSDNPVRNAYNYRRSQNNFDSTPKINTHCVRAFRRCPVL